MIEIARKDDLAAIAALTVKAYEEFAPKLACGAWEMMQQNLQNIEAKSKIAEFLLYRQDDRIVGSVAYCPAGKSDPVIFESNMASVLLLAVCPEFRGQGIAKALTQACIERARRDGAAAIALFTSELMQSAQHLYCDLGFIQDIELPRRYGVRYFRFVLKFAT
ncbi:GNAT family N-acetyltransferase [Synechococcus elongatus]|uniref:GNAT family N-acetyltransferase n=1 Tax=Synechococcus elongatus PCC 11802 TaxID=2283154 RepID=A0AAT9JYR3_SYNEL|nr:GNAT family N-acetyltransferase [Synechococcus elongatus]